jgi:hypothetical protein
VENYHIKLTEAETTILAKIDLRDDHRGHTDGHLVYQTNAEPILALLESLSERSAIPKERLKYWTEQRYNPGRIKASRKELFERNGCRGTEIYTHPHFVRYLRYFLFGAELPDNVVTSFEAKVGNPQWVTSSDIVPIGKCARDLTRRHNLNRAHAPEEFFKLCIDMGLGLHVAESVMRAVNQVR